MSEADALAPAADRRRPAAAAARGARALASTFAVRGGFFGKAGVVRAVDDVSFSVDKGEVLGIVGESGCGKSTTARLVIGLIAAGRGRDHARRREASAPTLSLRDLRRRVQMVFQDSYASLNPRLTIEDIDRVRPEGARRRADEARARAHDLLRKVGPRSGDLRGALSA